MKYEIQTFTKACIHLLIQTDNQTDRQAGRQARTYNINTNMPKFTNINQRLPVLKQTITQLSNVNQI